MTALAAHSTTVSRTTRPRTHRADLQGLRAVAVLLVIAYHVRPSLFPGGFVGVDVFFVLSGYLIVGSLATEAISTGRIALSTFYARRVRRLLPASSVVIVSTLLVGLILFPTTQWSALGTDAMTSALQIQNWMLAFGPNEYAQATAATSPFQHFWSLAVEEQFYAVIPLVIIVTIAIAARLRASTLLGIVTVISAVFAVSLAWSVFYSTADHQAAYFATTTRMWELCLGALLALVGRRLEVTRSVSVVLGSTGAVAIVASAFLLTTTISFPGWIALLPTLGAAALIISGQTKEPSAVTRLLSWRPATYVGDISYSLYLWHWPVIVFAFVLTGSERLPWAVALIVVALSFGLAVLSERYVERPFRRLRPRRSPAVFRYRTLLAGAAAVLVTVAVAGIPVSYVDARVEASGAATNKSHPGAMAFRGVAFDSAPVAPDPLVAQQDLPLANRDGCIDADVTLPDASTAICRYGPADADRSMVLVGDSHAAVLSTPLAQIAEANGIRLTVLVRNGCPFNIVPMGAGFEDCAARNERNLALILNERPDMVVVTNMSASGYQQALGWNWSSPEIATDGFIRTLRPIVEAGSSLLVVRDTPYAPFAAPDCVERHGDSAQCSFPRPDLAVSDDPLTAAAGTLSGAGIVDLTDAICREDHCRSVEGNVLVYRDNHLSDRYARSLAPWLADAIGLASPSAEPGDLDQ